MDVDFELENGRLQDEVAEFHQALRRGDDATVLQTAAQQLEAVVVGRGTHSIKAAKTGWNALTVTQQTACHQLVSAVASATQAPQRFQDGNGPRPPVLAPEGPGTQKM